MKSKTKLMFAVYVNGKRITRWRPDRYKTTGIAKKTSNNLTNLTGRVRSSVAVRQLTITKRVDEGSFAMIANRIAR